MPGCDDCSSATVCNQCSPGMYQNTHSDGTKTCDNQCALGTLPSVSSFYQSNPQLFSSSTGSASLTIPTLTLTSTATTSDQCGTPVGIANQGTTVCAADSALLPWTLSGTQPVATGTSNLVRLTCVPCLSLCTSCAAGLINSPTTGSSCV
jgi:hypothetical protein